MPAHEKRERQINTDYKELGEEMADVNQPPIERANAKSWLDEPFREEDRSRASPSRAPTPPMRITYPKDEQERNDILAVDKEAG